MGERGRSAVIALAVLSVLAVAPAAGAAVAGEVVAPPPGEVEVPPDPAPPGTDPDPAASQPPGQPPVTAIVARDDTATATVGVPAEIPVTDNDDVAPGFTLAVSTPPAHGTVQLQGVVFAYTADETVGGDDAFVYELCTADRSACRLARVVITIADGGAMTPETAGPEGTVVERAGPTAPSVCQQPLEWGGHGNGRIPDGEMRGIGEGQRLAAEAADAFVAMRDAAAAQGVTIGVTDSYRSFEAQVAVRAAKGGQVATATPGTSVHGWGKALDLKVGDPAVRTWLQQHSRAYAWINPPWAQRSGKSFEPWHYEYYGVGADRDDPRCAGIGSALTGAAPSEGASEAVTPALAAVTVPGRPMALGLGAVLALVGAGLILVRDVARSREIRDTAP